MTLIFYQWTMSVVARATTYGPDGKDILIMKDLEPWVMFWKNLDDDERAEKDVVNYIKNFTWK